MRRFVEQLLNQEVPAHRVDLDSAADARERFEKNTAKRLLRAFELLKGSDEYRDDFLLALRDYLLVMDTDMRLDSIQIPDENSFGLWRDAETGRYSASHQFPEYVTAQFARTVFSHPSLEARSEDRVANLATDPLIERLTGYQQFKTLAQKLSVYGALNAPAGYTALIALPTGGGKSLVTQVLAYQQAGLTIVIVPTVSLAIDQVRNARRIIRRENVDEEIFYYSSGVDSEPILRAIETQRARMLFISPETLMLNRRFADAIQRANEKRYLKNIIIDEAHIVVDWGASFRVEYQCLESWREKLLLKNPGIRTFLLSATFESRCVRILRLLFSREDRWIEIRCDALRREPRFMLVNARSNFDKYRKMIELVRKLPHPMIIYTARPDEAEYIKELLASHGLHNVRTFTGLTSSNQRRKLIDEWVAERFQIMVATSAFGVGVDKGDVRTVLHMYVPQNANTYYQELGRGGRDGLPCLSVMCIHNKDADAAFQRVSKRVMTVEKMMGRWDSMFNNPRSTRRGSLVYIDTSIKPNYYDSDEVGDAPASDADRNWNIYVLLFLRRGGLIWIRDVIWNGYKAIFAIEVVSEVLLSGGEELRTRLETLRGEEWDYCYNAYQMMRKNIYLQKSACWSEMFFNTYDYVSGYCAGCRAHDDVEDDGAVDYVLKKRISRPEHPLEVDQLALFGGATELAVIAQKSEWSELISKLLRMRLNVLVVSNDFEGIVLSDTSRDCRNLLVLNRNDFEMLVRGGNLFFVSGLVAVIEDGSAQEMLRQVQSVKALLGRREEVRVIHILREDVWLERYGRKLTDWIDGKVLRAKDIMN